MELSVLQRSGIPCAPEAARGALQCAWMQTHSAETNSSRARFLVSVAGRFRPMVRCRPPWLADERRQRRMRAASLFIGEARTLPGIDLLSWNVSLSASSRGGDLIVGVVRQMSAGDPDAYFPELAVTLLRPPGPGEFGRRVADFRRVAFSPSDKGIQVNFTGAAQGDLYGYRVTAKPAHSWVCQGANDGCQKRYAMLEDLLLLTEEYRAGRGVQA